jgi:hypothetical protein
MPLELPKTERRRSSKIEASEVRAADRDARPVNRNIRPVNNRDTRPVNRDIRAVNRDTRAVNRDTRAADRDSRGDSRTWERGARLDPVRSDQSQLPVTNRKKGRSEKLSVNRHAVKDDAEVAPRRSAVRERGEL